MIASDTAGCDSEIAAVVKESAEALRQLSGYFSGEREAPPDAAAFRAGVTNIDKLRTAADELCASKDFESALPVAMQWLMMQPHSAHAAFVLATCLQRAGQHQIALVLFGRCAQMQGEHLTPSPIFRAGECLLAMNMNEQAIAAFQAVIELTSDHERHQSLAAAAQANIDAILQQEQSLRKQTK